MHGTDPAPRRRKAEPATHAKTERGTLVPTQRRLLKKSLVLT
jgi:hypothetical protein